MAEANTLVVIPVYNEADDIEAFIRRVMAHAPVCVVDDCSRDGTTEILSRNNDIHLIRHETNTHYGGAVIDGMRYALERGYEFVVTLDAGLSHDPDQLPRFLEAPPVDFVVGVRDSGHEWDAPPVRRLLSRAGTLLMNIVLRNSRGERFLHDCTSGYRRYSRRAIELVTTTPLRGRSFDFVLETLALILWSGLSVSEVAISYKRSTSSIDARAVRDALKMWWALFYWQESYFEERGAGDEPVQTNLASRSRGRGGVIHRG